jgi:hypothetical protein
VTGGRDWGTECRSATEYEVGLAVGKRWSIATGCRNVHEDDLAFARFRNATECVRDEVGLHHAV